MQRPAPPAINGVVETILYTDDLARATAFYSDVLGLAPMKGDGDRFQAFDSGAGRVLLLFKRGGTLEPQPVAHASPSLFFSIKPSSLSSRRSHRPR